MVNFDFALDFNLGFVNMEKRVTLSDREENDLKKIKVESKYQSKDTSMWMFLTAIEAL